MNTAVSYSLAVPKYFIDTYQALAEISSKRLVKTWKIHIIISLFCPPIKNGLVGTLKELTKSDTFVILLGGRDKMEVSF